jgi:hypothetical protein
MYKRERKMRSTLCSQNFSESHNKTKYRHPPKKPNKCAWRLAIGSIKSIIITLLLVLHPSEAQGYPQQGCSFFSTPFQKIEENPVSEMTSL